ncbi:glucosamine-6-phosphate deaminase [Fusibacter sp. 3D3]|uniref:glucosamine-6-phosphate deaminase n=1 Tax=Fusibacter sp. 3D3 TaxID=1048380 RepID=UPI0008536EC8|nr:glucosamine-6-phosphate deaminase [Fusibacter sp. 3D3]GAU76310.1 glucosamine-6-phosphate deaminase [Fusibacter sp. 3D3]
MEIIKVKSYRELSFKAAQFVASQVILKPESILGLATGSTPEGMYSEIVKMYHNGIVDFEKVTSFNLDEYIGLGGESDQSYIYYMQHHLFNHVNIAPSNINMPNGLAEDIDKECLEYETRIAKSGGLDLQILGIGRNGHIGFNEPDLKFEARTHVVFLDEQTIEDNSRFFDAIEEVPKKAISMGVKTIMHAKKIVLLASGAEKAESVYKMIYGKIIPELPASVLQLHPNVTVICDEAAASLL